MNIFQKLFHKIEHWTKMNSVSVISWKDKDNIYICLKCDKCGHIYPPEDTIKIVKDTTNYDDTDT